MLLLLHRTWRWRLGVAEERASHRRTAEQAVPIKLGKASSLSQRANSKSRSIHENSRRRNDSHELLGCHEGQKGRNFRRVVQHLQLDGRVHPRWKKHSAHDFVLRHKQRDPQTDFGAGSEGGLQRQTRKKSAEEETLSKPPPHVGVEKVAHFVRPLGAVEKRKAKAH